MWSKKESKLFFAKYIFPYKVFDMVSQCYTKTDDVKTDASTYGFAEELHDAVHSSDCHISVKQKNEFYSPIANRNIPGSGEHQSANLLLKIMTAQQYSGFTAPWIGKKKQNCGVFCK